MSGAVVWPGVSHFARFGASALFGGLWDRLGVFLGWYPGGLWCWSDPSTGRKIDNVLNEKVVTPPCNGAGLTPSFVWGFSLWGSLEWSGIVSPWEWGLEA